MILNSYFVNVVGDGVLDNLVRADIGIDTGWCIDFVVPRRNDGPYWLCL